VPGHLAGRTGHGIVIWNLSAWWLFMAVSVVTILSFILSMGLSAVIGRDGVGPTPMTVIITGGFFGSIYLLNLYGVRLSNLQEASFAGLVGAFIVLMTVLVLKSAINRP
jgi:amino acid transporter